MTIIKHGKKPEPEPEYIYTFEGTCPFCGCVFSCDSRISYKGFYYNFTSVCPEPFCQKVVCMKEICMKVLPPKDINYNESCINDYYYEYPKYSKYTEFN